MKVVEIKYQNEAECSASVAIWNYYDLEHFIPVHKGWGEFITLYESADTISFLGTMKSPFLPFLTVNSLVVQVRHDDNTLKVINTMLGVSVLSTIKITEIRKDYSAFEMSYKFIFMGWREFLLPAVEPILRRLVVFWNDRQWREDLPVKLRRQKVLRLGFKDFKGLPDKISERHYDGPIKNSLPVPRLKDSYANIPESLL